MELQMTSFNRLPAKPADFQLGAGVSKVIHLEISRKKGSNESFFVLR
jgi:hypothetical protein